MLKSFFHWKVLLNLFLAAIVFTGLVWLTFRWLEIHTNHGKEIPVPNVMNRSVHDAIKILDDSGLEYEVDSFKYDPKYRPFQVLQIYPSPGSRVKDGRTIILKVNPRTWAQVSVPDILDRYKGLAFRQLEQVGLKIGDTIFEPSIQRDAVLRMLYNGSTLKPGALLPRFSTIDLVIGSGPRRNIIIPNLVGLTVQEAKAVIAQNLFELGLVEYETGGHDESDIVYYQDPPAFDVRDQGMQIDIWASKKTPAEMEAKISQLNSIYRIKIDTTTPSSNHYENSVYREPTTKVSTPKTEVPKTEIPKVEIPKTKKVVVE
jgi:serine/threonine-protein kinase